MSFINDQTSLNDLVLAAGGSKLISPKSGMIGRGTDLLGRHGVVDAHADSFPVVVPVVAVGGFRRREGTVKQIPGADPDGVHEGFVSKVHAHHVLLDELIDARDFLVQGGFHLVVLKDLLVNVRF